MRSQKTLSCSLIPIGINLKEKKLRWQETWGDQERGLAENNEVSNVHAIIVIPPGCSVLRTIRAWFRRVRRNQRLTAAIMSVRLVPVGGKESNLPISRPTQWRWIKGEPGIPCGCYTRGAAAETRKGLRFRGHYKCKVISFAGQGENNLVKARIIPREG